MQDHTLFDPRLLFADVSANSQNTVPAGFDHINTGLDEADWLNQYIANDVDNFDLVDGLVELDNIDGTYIDSAAMNWFDTTSLDVANAFGVADNDVAEPSYPAPDVSFAGPYYGEYGHEDLQQQGSGYIGDFIQQEDECRQPQHDQLRLHNSTVNDNLYPAGDLGNAINRSVDQTHDGQIAWVPGRDEKEYEGGRTRLPGKMHNGKRQASKWGNKNRRTQNIQEFDPTRFYAGRHFDSILSRWGPADAVTGRPVFRYTEQGELFDSLRYTPSELNDFITNHPCHGKGDHYFPKDSSLVLRIQSHPADSAKRAGQKLADKCRFLDCPVLNNSITKGQFRVAFDEVSGTSGLTSDPYHNAGYVHLYCLEKFLDFPQICSNFDVRPETRNFEEGRNKMAIDRDHSELLDLVNGYLAVVGTALPRDGCFEFDYKYTLCHMLTKLHLALEPEKVQVMRAARDLASGGNSNPISKWVGDLDLYAQKDRLKQCNIKRPTSRKTPRGSKRLAQASAPDGADDDMPTASRHDNKRVRKS